MVVASSGMYVSVSWAVLRWQVGSINSSARGHCVPLVVSIGSISNWLARYNVDIDVSGLVILVDGHLHSLPCWLRVQHGFHFHAAYRSSRSLTHESLPFLFLSNSSTYRVQCSKSMGCGVPQYHIYRSQQCFLPYVVMLVVFFHLSFAQIVIMMVPCLPVCGPVVNEQ